MNLALLVVDMQKAYLEKVDPVMVRRTVEHINYAAEIMRSAGCPIIHIQDIEEAPTLGMDELAIIDDIAVDERDLHVTKIYSNAFWETDLKSILTARQVDFVVVAGYAAEYCVLFTYNGAYERGFKAAMLQGGIVSSKNDVITAAYRDRHLISYPVIEAMISG
ncbi:cysteine hydrolase family protein [Gorillibacterium massiliense]|uniref:cysteine hydrolase family protein n=1 Tax=Gorillibacterium massiliense TaxID=1280390 RepID=UPI0004BA0802|nr:isochorismatase family protein [Gorillibacterium massiliense]